MTEPRRTDPTVEPPQPFPDESKAADEKRPEKDNDRIRADEARQQDEKAALVDKAHGLSR